MGGQILDVVRQGIWASLTGGWFVDPSLSNFCNTFHLYTWLAFLIVPFILCLVVTPTFQLPAWTAYCCFVAVTFTLLKVINYRLHSLFDTSEAVEATQGENEENHAIATLGDQGEPEVFELNELRESVTASDSGGQGHPADTRSLSLTDAEPCVPTGSTAPAVHLHNRTASSGEPAAVIVHTGALRSSSPQSSLPSTSRANGTQSTSSILALPRELSDSNWPRLPTSTVADDIDLPVILGVHSQPRWPDSPSMLRSNGVHGGGASMYSSHHIIRRRNAVRRRTKSAHDSPRMLVSECRPSDDPRIRLEWSGSPHPSPRPRQRVLSLHGSDLKAPPGCPATIRSNGVGTHGSGRRSSWELHTRRPLPILRHHHSDRGRRFMLAADRAIQSLGYDMDATVDGSATGDGASGDSNADGHAKDFLERVRANRTLAQARLGQNVGSGLRMPGRPRARLGSSSPRGSATAIEPEDDGESLTAGSSYSDVFVCTGPADVGSNSICLSNEGVRPESTLSKQHDLPATSAAIVASTSSDRTTRTGNREARWVHAGNAALFQLDAPDKGTDYAFRSLDGTSRWDCDSTAATAAEVPTDEDVAISSGDVAIGHCRINDRKYGSLESASALTGSTAALRLWLVDSMESFDCEAPCSGANGQRRAATPPPRRGQQRDLKEHLAYSVAAGPSGKGAESAQSLDGCASALSDHMLQQSAMKDEGLSSATPSPSSASSATEVSSLLCHAGSSSGWEDKMWHKETENLPASKHGSLSKGLSAQGPHSSFHGNTTVPHRHASHGEAAGTGAAAATCNDEPSAAGGDENKLHYFKDEEGQWWAYSFGPNAVPRRLGSDFCPPGDVENDSDSDSDTDASRRRPRARNRSPPPPPSPKPVVSMPQATSVRSSLAHPLPLTGSEGFVTLSLIERDLSLIDDLISRDSSGELLGRLQQAMAHGQQQQQQRQHCQQQQGETTRHQLRQHQLDVLWQRRRLTETVVDNASSRAVTLSTTSGSGSQVTVREADSARPVAEARRHYYNWKFLPKVTLRVWLDRLSLLSLMDRNASIWENVMSVGLAVLVAALTSALLAHGFYHDIWILIFCAVAAGCQYSLLKSVQPDAASPTHGYNRVIVFSRAFYFCVCASLILGFSAAASRWDERRPFIIYGLQLVSKDTLLLAQHALSVFLLCLPIIFTVGLLPQITTFLQFVCEQVEIHIFGGNGTSSPLTSLYAVTQSGVVAVILYAFCLIPVQLTYAQEDALRWPAKSAKHVTFSVFCGLYVALSYLTSRLPSDPTHLRTLVSHWFGRSKRTTVRLPGTASADPAAQPVSPPGAGAGAEGLEDPLPYQLLALTSERVRANVVASVLIAVFAFSIHVSTVFSALQPTLHYVLCASVSCLGFLLHYVGPQLRKEYPWLCCAHPLLETYERRQFEVREAARITSFEKAYIWLCFIEKNIAYPALLLSALTISAEPTLQLFGRLLGPLVLSVCGLKVLRAAYSDASHHYMVIAFTTLLFSFDWQTSPEHNLLVLNYAVMFVLYFKLCDFYTKVQFVLVYIAPWQLAWGSAFHAFAQPLSVPHSVMMFAQAALSAIFSAPLNPFLGSAIFITSYCRPVKFWEKDYNTKRVDHSNVRLASHLDHDLGTDDNNLNSVFYEHLTRTLQKVLCGDITMGRWGQVTEGDMFIMASDYLNAMVHIIEVGNGLVTFQLRGLEFRGTYCQQREVDAITEGVEEDKGFCCCHPGHMPHFLSVNAAFGQRWLAWQVAAAKYVLEGYSISDNNAVSMLQVYDLRLVLLTYYVKSTIFNAIHSPLLVQWLGDGENSILISLKTYDDDTFVDLDRSFSILIDADYDARSCGVTRESFCRVYLPWIRHCASQRAAALGTEDDTLAALLDIKDHRSSPLVLLCFGLSLLARRALATASRNNYSSGSADFFLFGLHALFKGDFRITSSRDEWVLKDVELLRKVVAPAIRMALKLQQDHFTSSEEYDNCQILYDAITEYEKNLVISHETDPVWRSAILAGRPSLLALRHMFDEGSDSYKIIMLNKRYLSFRIIKVNRECVRGMWAGQQQELIFLRNRNTERGSIQNAKQALRNMVNSSCDQPIGYPIYVSPLTTSYAGSSEQLCSVMGRELPLRGTRDRVAAAWAAVRHRCGGSRRSLGTAGMDGIEMGSLSGTRPAVPPVQLTNITSLSSGATGSHSAGIQSSSSSVRQQAASLPPKPTLPSAVSVRGRSISLEAGRRSEERAAVSFI